MSKDFIWNDELVNDFAAKMAIEAVFNSNNRTTIEDFKASHQPKQQINEWEIVEYACPFAGKDGVIFSLYCGGSSGSFVAYSGTNEEVFHQESTLIKYGSIHSVKRLNDNEIFSIGDEVGFDFAGRLVLGHINHFTFSEGIIDIYLTEDVNTCYRLNKVNEFMTDGIGQKLKKLPPNKEPQPFQWDDELVFEYANTVLNDYVAGRTPVKVYNFKKLKQPSSSINEGKENSSLGLLSKKEYERNNPTEPQPQNNKERLKLISFVCKGSGTYNTVNYKLNLSRQVTLEEFNKIKQAIE